MNLEWRKKPQTSIHPLVTLSARLSHYRGLSWARNGTVEEGDKGNEKGVGAVEGRGPGQAWAGDGEQRAQQDEGLCAAVLRGISCLSTRRPEQCGSEGTDGQGGSSVGGHLCKQ